MSKYQYSKLVMEKFLRRSFYDAVLELYETAQGTRIISVSLEGNLSLVVNKDESFIIKLNEIAQRADDREEHHHRQKSVNDMKTEAGSERYLVKKEEEFLPNTSVINSSLGNVVINIDGFTKDNEKFITEVGGEVGKMYFSDVKYKTAGMMDEKSNEVKEETDAFEKSSEGESESEDEIDLDIGMVLHRHSLIQSENLQTMPGKAEIENASGEDICFLPVAQADDFKRKYEFREQEQVELTGKRSPRKKRKPSYNEGDEEGVKVEDRERGGVLSTNGDDGSSGGLQLLPHTGKWLFETFFLKV